MALIKPFRAVRPPKHLAEKVAALPYDVMNVTEAQRMAAGNPCSFLHISRPEIDLPAETDPYADAVYTAGRENLQRFMAEGTLAQDPEAYYYVYRQRMGGIAQTGLVVCAGVDDYESGVIKKHELTRADKEEDRVKHIDYLDANDEPVFYTYRNEPAITALVARVAEGEPEYDFTTDDGVGHTLWVVRERAVIDELTDRFAAIPTLYVADGHHRSAAAGRVRGLRRAANPHHGGAEEYNWFLTVIFPDSEMNIMPYNRVVKDLNGLSAAEFMTRVGDRFDVTPVETPFSPADRHEFGMYLEGRWYRLTAKPGSYDEAETVSHLDVSILQNNLLSPVLAIRDPRTDQRIAFVGGIRGINELERLVAEGSFRVAFALHPTSMEELMQLADAGEIMPPKSTWFEPKLRSGLFVHLLS
ncbi:DUF1015 domain-containing protein [Geobacter pickeringii]|uniref:SpoOJ/ParA/ParB/repB family protein n=1 Tax=Geobacter pickeringii TaxID=345632 RepID=A0A0B5BGT7_9BACT|nr:DUF1015 family protein [Geobacter pickeringii]AJE03730.1 hypothetical protein GPICK_10540 [Geobacter pickeringii]